MISHAEPCIWREMSRKPQGTLISTIAELCLIATLVLWLATIGLAKGFGWRDYDNANPRS